MSVLDQAFIKAFSRQSVAAPLPKSRTPAPMPALNDRVASRAAPVESTAGKPRDNGVDAVLAAFEKPPARPAPVIKTASNLNVSETIGDGGLCAVANAVWPTEAQSWTFEAVPWMPEERQPTPCPTTVGETAVASLPVAQVCDVVESIAENVEAVEPSPSPSPSAEATAPQEHVKIKMFRPAWQVERFSWPRACRQLMSRASGEWDRLADAVEAAGDEGRKVLAIAGLRRGEGATTVLLCIARRMAERGVRTALADADLARPRLAKRLGVQTQLGWNEISDGGVEQAVVEAERGALALLALGEPAANVPGDWGHWTECIDTLRNRYQTVLVDPGPLDRVGDDCPPWAADGAVDAVLLVHNRRITSEGELQQLRRRLASAGVHVAGVIENFVAE
jgi:Mrp family chromosome partitioning ATPase